MELASCRCIIDRISNDVPLELINPMEMFMYRMEHFKTAGKDPIHSIKTSEQVVKELEDAVNKVDGKVNPSLKANLEKRLQTTKTFVEDYAKVTPGQAKGGLLSSFPEEHVEKYFPGVDPKGYEKFSDLPDLSIGKGDGEEVIQRSKLHRGSMPQLSALSQLKMTSQKQTIAIKSSLDADKSGMSNAPEPKIMISDGKK